MFSLPVDFCNGLSPISFIFAISVAGAFVTASLFERENCPIDWNNFLLFSLYEVTCSFVPEAAWAAP